MDDQNLQNEQQNTVPESVPTDTNYQDYTANIEQPVTENVVAAEEPKKSNSLAIVSLVLGIIAIVLGCCGSWIAIALGIGGIVCSVLSKKEGKTRMATAGMICSIVGIVLAIIIMIVVGVFLVAYMNEMGAMGY